jgi:carbamoyl-phosphate synthase large subunit
MNILILSCGTRNKIVQYFKKELAGRGKVIATDCNELAPALYVADKYYIVPKITDSGYLNLILDICKKENIKAVLSLIDPELSLLAQNKSEFLKIGVTPIVSDSAVVETCFDKMKMYKFCKENDINTVPSYSSIKDFKEDYEIRNVNFPVFVKPVTGSCSIQIQKIENMNELENVCGQNNNLIIQKFMSGQEYGVDVYTDLLSNEVVAIFAKKKLLMRAGETDKSVSFKNQEIFKFVKYFVERLRTIGNIDIDIFEQDGEFYISEVNPRFGGGYPHAYESGVNFINLIVNNLSGNINENIIGDYEEGIYMMKYLEVMIKRSIE